MIPLLPRVLVPLLFLVGAGVAQAQVRVNPNGVNVNGSGATTVFLTFGGLATDQRAAEALWCGELISAAPAIGFRCDPATIFGRLPARFDLSTSSGARGFTDIMSIPPSVARRAFQAAQEGARSSFFYVRRFVSTTGRPDEFVTVTCRMAGGGARVPFSIVDVRLAFAGDPTVLSLPAGAVPPAVTAQIVYTGTGRLTGRWEVVRPGEELPDARDLLTEASLPIEERGTQRRFTQLSRFNEFLPPTGKVTLPGPDVSRLPTSVDGMYLLLLRIEASDDKEADSNLEAAGAGLGTVHSGAVAGFPLPVLRYVVGSATTPAATVTGDFALLQPGDQAVLDPAAPVDLTWVATRGAAVYRVEVESPDGTRLLAALVQGVDLTYRLPSWIKDKAAGAALRWRVVALDVQGNSLRTSPWRTARFGS